MVLAAVGVGGQALAAVLDPPQRRADLARGPGQRDLLRQQDALVAEAAADIGRHHADLALVQPEAFGKPRAHDVRLLGRGVHDELAQPRVPLRDHAAPLERAHDLAGGAQLARHRHGRLGLDGLEVHVDGAGEIEVVAPVLVHERRAGLARLQHVGDDRQRLEVQLDLAGEVLGLRPRRRDAHGDQLADVAHLARSEHRLQRRLEARQRRVGPDRRHARQVLGDEHAVADRRRDADAPDARMRQRAAQERHLQHARQPDVADILAAPAHVAVVLLAQEACAYALAGHAASPRLRGVGQMIRRPAIAGIVGWVSAADAVTFALRRQSARNPTPALALEVLGYARSRPLRMMRRRPGRANPTYTGWRTALPPLCVEGNAFDAGRRIRCRAPPSLAPPCNPTRPTFRTGQ